MIEPELLKPVLHVLSMGICAIGVVTWGCAIGLALALRFSKDFCIEPTARVLRILQLSAHRGIMALLLVSAAYAPAGLALYFLPAYVTPFGVAVFTAVLGGAGFFLVGPKGWELPLGQGLSLTIDHAPSVGVKLSTYVISFHVKEDFMTHRHEVATRIAEVMLQVQAAGGSYDFVMKSWLFAHFDAHSAQLIKQVRRRMRSLRRTFFVGAIPLLAAGEIWLIASLKDSAELLSAGLWVLVGGLGLATLISGLLLHACKKRMQAVCVSLGTATAVASRVMAKEVCRKAPGFSHHFIAHRPIRLLHLVSLCVTMPKVIRTCRAAEAGVVLN